MDRISPRVLAALAALPISVLAIPYCLWRGTAAPWYRKLVPPLLVVFIAWLLLLLVPLWPAVVVGFAAILWQSYSVRGIVERHRPFRR